MGTKIDRPVELEHDRDDHPVYRPSDGDGDAGPVDGTILGLNYSLHGELNGVHLDDGTFVHVKPHKAGRYDLRVGNRITASGDRHVGSDAAVIDAKTVKVVDRARR